MCMVCDISDTGRLGSGHMWDLNPLGLEMCVSFFYNIPGTACAWYVFGLRLVVMPASSLWKVWKDLISIPE
jgi:hypothetical protein